MGKRAPNRRQRPAGRWKGIDGRNPLTLAPESLRLLVPRAAEHIAAVGVDDDGRPSLAGCWVIGEHMIDQAVNAGQAPDWTDDAHPLVVAYLGATADPQLLSLPLAALTAAADGWGEALDAAGANDRLRAFTDAVDRLVRHDNPHGHPLNQALAVELAGRPLALEPLARRLLPAAAVAADPADADAAYPPGPRRTATASTVRLNLPGEDGETIAEALRQAFDQAAELGLAPDASLGEIMAAQGTDADHVDAGMLAVLEEVDPAAAYAWLATDGLLLTEANVRLVDPADAQRWQQAAGAYQAIFELADQLIDTDPEDGAWPDTVIDAAGMAVEELVACIEDGAMKAWEHLVDRIQAHPAAEDLLGGMDFDAFTQVSGRVQGVGEQVALDAARRLAVTRFDDAVVLALDGVVQAEGGLPEGDIVVHTHAPDPQQRLAVWTALLAGLRAATQ